MNFLKGLLAALDHRISTINPKLHTNYFRRKGVQIGKNTVIFSGAWIDITRPCLVEIGSNCVLTSGVWILTHGWDLAVLIEKYGEIFCSSGKVVIEDNVFVGINTIVLKGVRIGKNSIIGAGSVVTHNIPAESVAAGNPCKVIMTLNEYYEKRKKLYKEEAKAYALEKYRKTMKVPTPEDFWEESPLFLKRDGDWGKIPVSKKSGSAMNKFLSSKPFYDSFEDFLIDAGIPRESICLSRKRLSGS